MEKLGDPRFFNAVTTVPTSFAGHITASKELIKYVDSIEGHNAPLKRYCTHLLLFMFGNGGRDPNHALSITNQVAKQYMKTIVGSGVITEFVLALLYKFGELDVSLSEWTPADYTVTESK